MMQEADAKPGGPDVLTERYTRALRDYLDGADEDALIKAYELGREAVASGVGVVELALLHHAAVAHLVPRPAPGEQERSAQFLAESLSPFELTHRGFREANQQLEQLIRELRSKNQQLEQTAFELRVANDVARNAIRELDAFSHTVAHDLRSPLNGMIGFAELLVDHVQDAKLRTFADEIVTAGRRLNLLIGALLEFARGARTELRREPVDLSAIAERSVSALSMDGRYTRAEISIEPGLRAVGDPALIDIVMTNLLSNALKYSAQVDAPKVEVGATGTTHGAATFFVRDNGAGFDMKHAGRLFGVFQRLHTAEAFEGHGVGLATVQRIVRRHGGEVWAESELGQGATFYFTLDARTR